MANRTLKQPYTLEAGVVSLYGYIILGASGAISAQKCKGFKVTKTATKTGRYTIELEDKYNGLLGVKATFEGAADATYGTGGVIGFVRAPAVSATPPLLYFQVASAVAAPVDVEAPSGTKIYFALTLKNSTAF